MIENLCMYGLPFASRQNEMIEMALTFRFSGIEVDLDEMVRRAEAMGQEFATQFVNSANIEVALFRLPIDFGAEPAQFDAALERLESWCSMAEAIEAKRCYAMIAPGSDHVAFQENFERHIQRLGQVADRLAKSSIRMGLGLNASAGARSKYAYQFICKPEELLTLIKMVDRPNVGLSLDTWHWQLGNGGLDQIQDFDISKVFDVRLADLPEKYDAATVSLQDRRPPSDQRSGFTVKLLEYLKQKNYDQTIAAVCSFPDFNDRSRGVKTAQKIRGVLNRVLKEAGIIEEEYTISVGISEEYTRHSPSVELEVDDLAEDDIAVDEIEDEDVASTI
ncbi:MAG TPA: TIM barrel protein [Pirellulaceae bacterium]|nr:TIM barrel protein [Pirellulaceae bacterium]HMO91209.1 TIM barrel protein [Pirellulaceae bacterium]HMP70792.1 TIM barrel protein [Pirellulaceae bacterium]